MPITLPKRPDGKQYEDLVVASLKALGYFTETSLTLREGSQEILELDVIATPNGEGGQARELFEAKTDAFHFENIFKLFGQLTYLKIARGCLVGLKAADPIAIPVYQSKGNDLGIRMCHYTLDSPVESLAPPKNALTPDQRARVTTAGWYQQIARRISEAAFFQECKSRPTQDVCQRARTYLFNVRAGFFQPNPLARTEALYNAYLVSPRLSGEAIQLVSQEIQISEQAAWNKVNDSQDWPWIQALMQTETTGRLTIVKNALDDVVERGGAQPPQIALKVGALSLNVPLHALPQNFYAGLDLVRNHPHRSKLPYLFKVFAELLGGFLVLGDEEELSFIEALTGVPKEEIVDALGLLDKFFPPGGGTWFYRQGNELLCMKMIPGTVRGGGAFLRRLVFSIDDYATRYPTMGWLIVRWHNALYNLLEPYLRVS